MNDIIEGRNFMTVLDEHNLSALEFLDLVDGWQRLSYKTRDILITEEIERKKRCEVYER